MIVGRLGADGGLLLQRDIVREIEKRDRAKEMGTGG